MDIDTSYGYSGADWAYFSSTERKWINKITKLAESNPDLVQIIKRADENDGSVYCRIKPSLLRISVPARRAMTEEQRQAARERARKMIENKEKKKKEKEEKRGE